MPVPFAERVPTPEELERFRLILSTYQDGTGMLLNKQVPTRTLPGWRDFERTVALAFDGIPSENKAIFDVKIEDPERQGTYFGISCKMKNALDQIERPELTLGGRAFIELSNANKDFWTSLATDGINENNYKLRPDDVGTNLIGLVQSWHTNVGLQSNGEIDLAGSCYLTLSYNREGWYQLHQFPIELPSPQNLTWKFLERKEKGVVVVSNTLLALDNDGRVLQWHGTSGGQLKYYPPIDNALWSSEKFQLEPLPANVESEILTKAQAYFRHKWPTN